MSIQSSNAGRVRQLADQLARSQGLPDAAAVPTQDRARFLQQVTQANPSIPAAAVREGLLGLWVDVNESRGDGLRKLNATPGYQGGRTFTPLERGPGAFSALGAQMANVQSTPLPKAGAATQVPWSSVDRGVSSTGAPVHGSTSLRDHAEAAFGKVLIAMYDGARAVERVVRGEARRPEPPAWLNKAWAADQGRPFEFPTVRKDLHAQLGPQAALSAASQHMAWTPQRGDQETRAAAAFFQDNPSGAARTITWFQSIWNAFETFDNYPLQAFMYASASPVTTPESSSVKGNPDPTPAGTARMPKTPLWEAYARAVKEKLDPALIDEAYMRAHMGDMKTAFSSERFKQLYDLTPPNYRIVVEAYAETIARGEAELNSGRPAPDVSRGLFVDGLRDLVKRDTVGMLWSVEGFKNLGTLSSSMKDMMGKTVDFLGLIGTPDRPASSKPLLDNVLGWFRNEGAFKRAMADGTVEVHEVWEITQTLRGFSGTLDQKDLNRIAAFAKANDAHFTQPARDAVAALLAAGPSGKITAAQVAAAPQVSATRVAVDLTPEQYGILRSQFRINIPDGAKELTPEMFQNAVFSEPDRREDRSTPVKTWPLRLSDLTDRQLRDGLTMAGTDGKLQFEEILGGVRNVQARVRSKLVDDFHQKYPVAPGGILQYSANLLTLHRTYGENEFYGMVPNAIMPVDNDGNPKNQLWRDFTNAYDQHKATGKPDMAALEKLWIRAHMEDFRAVDGPAFQKKADVFWTQAAKDPALESMAVYAKAMVLGRKVFERAREGNLSEEGALYESLKHFTSTMATTGTFPFWKEDVHAAVGYLFGKDGLGKDGPTADDRGLPTDRVIAQRTASGLRDMGGLMRLFAKGFQQVNHNG